MYASFILSKIRDVYRYISLIIIRNKIINGNSLIIIIIINEIYEI